MVALTMVVVHVCIAKNYFGCTSALSLFYLSAFEKQTLASLTAFVYICTRCVRCPLYLLLTGRRVCSTFAVAFGGDGIHTSAEASLRVSKQTTSILECSESPAVLGCGRATAVIDAWIPSSLNHSRIPR